MHMAIWIPTYLRGVIVNNSFLAIDILGVNLDLGRNATIPQQEDSHHSVQKLYKMYLFLLDWNVGIKYLEQSQPFVNVSPLGL